ncbi:MAG: TetR/AcrR family transcriptional regulator [Bacilli bacterium]|jgi:AcrR family transcriptional regulator|nr:TetR/AcrR family transcriptional regulator [Bacilli bacterium]
MAGKSIITKEELLKVAMSMIEKNGAECINARDLAKEAGISTKPIYRLYNSLEDLKKDANEIIKKEYDEFIMKRVDNKNALITVCVAYIEFAQMHKNYFRSMFLSNNLKWQSVNDVLNEKWNQSTIINLVNKHSLSFDNAKNLFMNVWIYANGLATLIASNELTIDNKEILIRIVKIYKEFSKNLPVKQ